MKRLSLAALIGVLIAGCGSSRPAAPTLPTPSQAAPQTHVPSEHLAHPRLNATPKPGLASPSPLTGVSTLAGEDAVTITNIPLGEPVVGCYVTGRYANCGAAQARFPNSHIVTIATYASYTGNARCLDVEPSDATPAEAPQFVRHELSLGVQPCVYAAESLTGYEMWRVQNDLTFAGIDRSKYLEWIANWNGNPALASGTDAHQWDSNAFVDKDTFGSWFFTQPKPPAPNLPGCDTSSTSTSHCYGRFATVKVYNRTAGGWCYFGCVERSIVKSYDAERPHPVKNRAVLTKNEQRLRWLHLRLDYLINHRSYKVNKAAFAWGREHEDYNRGVRHLVCKSWRACDW